MDISFLFDTSSNHVFTAQQNVAYLAQPGATTPQGEIDGWNASLTLQPSSNLGSGQTIVAGRFDSALNAPGITFFSSSILYGSYSSVHVDAMGGGAITIVGSRSDATLNAGASDSCSMYGLDVHTMAIQRPNALIVKGINLTMGSNILATTMSTQTGLDVNMQMAGSTSTAVTGVWVHSMGGDSNNNQKIGVRVDDQYNALGACYAIKTGTGQVYLGDQLLVNGGLNYKRTTVNDANVVAVPGDTCIALTAISFAHTVTLPAASAVPSGHLLTLVDESGGVTAVRSWTVNRAGADTINGLTSYVMSTAYANLQLMSDGASKWTIIT